MAIVITPNDLGTSLHVVSGKVQVNYGATLVQDGSGKLGINPAAIAGVETPVTVGAGQATFLTITPGGVNGHAITIGANWTDAAFVEAVQDAVGAAILAAAGGTITYDDVANTIATSMGNLAFPMTVTKDGSGAVLLTNDVAAPGNSFYYGTNGAGAKGWYAMPPTGVSADAGNYLVNGADGKAYLGPTTPGLVDVTDLAGNHLYYGLP